MSISSAVGAGPWDRLTRIREIAIKAGLSDVFELEQVPSKLWIGAGMEDFWNALKADGLMSREALRRTGDFEQAVAVAVKWQETSQKNHIEIEVRFSKHTQFRVFRVRNGERFSDESVWAHRGRAPRTLGELFDRAERSGLPPVVVLTSPDVRSGTLGKALVRLCATADMPESTTLLQIAACGERRCVKPNPSTITTRDLDEASPVGEWTRQGSSSDFLRMRLCPIKGVAGFIAMSPEGMLSFSVQALEHGRVLSQFEREATLKCDCDIIKRIIKRIPTAGKFGLMEDGQDAFNHADFAWTPSADFIVFLIPACPPEGDADKPGFYTAGFTFPELQLRWLRPIPVPVDVNVRCSLRPAATPASLEASDAVELVHARFSEGRIRIDSCRLGAHGLISRQKCGRTERLPTLHPHAWELKLLGSSHILLCNVKNGHSRHRPSIMFARAALVQTTWMNETEHPKRHRKSTSQPRRSSCSSTSFVRLRRSAGPICAESVPQEHGEVIFSRNLVVTSHVSERSKDGWTPKRAALSLWSNSGRLLSESDVDGAITEIKRIFVVRDKPDCDPIIIVTGQCCDSELTVGADFYVLTQALAPERATAPGLARATGNPSARSSIAASVGSTGSSSAHTLHPLGCIRFRDFNGEDGWDAGIDPEKCILYFDWVFLSVDALVSLASRPEFARRSEQQMMKLPFEYEGRDSTIDFGSFESAARVYLPYSSEEQDNDDDDDDDDPQTEYAIDVVVLRQYASLRQVLSQGLDRNCGDFACDGLFARAEEVDTTLGWDPPCEMYGRGGRKVNDHAYHAGGDRGIISRYANHLGITRAHFVALAANHSGGIPSRYAICLRAEDRADLRRARMRIWSPQTHHVFPERMRHAVRTLLLVGSRLETTGVLPLTDTGFWLRVLCFLPRDSFESRIVRIVDAFDDDGIGDD
jgi:hypothetical protein